MQNPETFFAGPGEGDAHTMHSPNTNHGGYTTKYLQCCSSESHASVYCLYGSYTLRTNSCMAASRVEAVLWELFDRMVPQGRAFELSLLNVAAANFQHIPGRTRQVR